MDADAVQLPAPVVRLTNHERVCLKLMDFGFTFPRFADVMPGLAERGLAEDRGNGRWHVTGAGRRAHQGRDADET